MNPKEKIEELQAKLAKEEEQYKDALKSSKDYNTLKAIRDNIREIKKNLQSLNKE
jgi:hypothetical protein